MAAWSHSTTIWCHISRRSDMWGSHWPTKSHKTKNKTTKKDTERNRERIGSSCLFVSLVGSSSFPKKKRKRRAMEKRPLIWLPFFFLLASLFSSCGEAIWLNLPASGTKCVSEEIQNNVVVLADYLVLPDDHSHHPTIAVKVCFVLITCLWMNSHSFVLFCFVCRGFIIW